MNLRGHLILIIESEVTAFVRLLRQAIDETGAESLVVSDPYGVDGLERIKRFKFSAALINIQHSSVINRLDVPVIVYGDNATPARPDVIVQKLS